MPGRKSKSTQLRDDLQDAVQGAMKGMFVKWLRTVPDLTLEELFELADDKELATLTVRECFSECYPKEDE